MAELSEVTEAVADEILEQAEGAAKVVRSLTQIKLAYAGIGAALGAAVSATIAWRVAYGKASAKFDKIAEAEIEEMRQHYVAKTEATMGRITKPELDEVIQELGYSNGGESVVIPAPETPEVEVTQNIFDNREVEVDVWDFADEAKNRTDPDVPYVVHRSEFNQDESYTQECLVYYEDDDVLADPKDDVIDQDSTVGVKNLAKFGHGSGDPNVVYVRHESTKMEYEIVRSNGSYAEEVHGFVQHSDVTPRGRSRRKWDG